MKRNADLNLPKIQRVTAMAELDFDDTEDFNEDAFDGKDLGVKLTENARSLDIRRKIEERLGQKRLREEFDLY